MQPLIPLSQGWTDPTKSDNIRKLLYQIKLLTFEIDRLKNV
jgi:hypothetical protein